MLALLFMRADILILKQPPYVVTALKTQRLLLLSCAKCYLILRAVCRFALFSRYCSLRKTTTAWSGVNYVSCSLLPADGMIVKKCHQDGGINPMRP